jgi:hypothetical protein
MINIYLSQHHDNDAALTLKESCSTRWNIGWLCRNHNALSLKLNGARNTNRYLIGEIAAQGENVRENPNWISANPSHQTHCHGGSGYEGHILFKSIDQAVAYLKCFFRVIACGTNCNETQEWIDKLENFRKPSFAPTKQHAPDTPITEYHQDEYNLTNFSPSQTSQSLDLQMKSVANDAFLQKVRVAEPNKAMSNSLRAALQRNKVYSTSSNQQDRSSFRLAWSELIAKSSAKYSCPVDDDAHCKTIEQISQELSDKFERILEGRKLRFGTSQKAFNLYLKFLWRLGQIQMPPHCPVDGIVLRKAGITGSWTQSDSVEEYMRWIGKLRKLARSQTLAEWEYALWNGNGD